jgi:hypothetical protein
MIWTSEREGLGEASPETTLVILKLWILELRKDGGRSLQLISLTGSPWLPFPQWHQFRLWQHVFICLLSTIFTPSSGANSRRGHKEFCLLSMNYQAMGRPGCTIRKKTM